MFIRAVEVGGHVDGVGFSKVGLLIELQNSMMFQAEMQLPLSRAAM
jgi:hypothetical protein